jgi:hypothetical protein
LTLGVPVRSRSTLASGNVICRRASGSWRRSGVNRSTDGGRAWRPFNVGLPRGGVGALRFPADGRVLYAGTLGYGVVVRTLPR